MMPRRINKLNRLLPIVVLVFLICCSLPAWADEAATPDARLRRGRTDCQSVLPAGDEAATPDARLLVRKLPGAQPGGAVLLPNQWSLRPAGRQIELGNFPVNIALHPQGHWAAVLHSGYGPHAVVVVDVTTRRIVSSVIVPKTLLRPVLLAQRQAAVRKRRRRRRGSRVPLCRRLSLRPPGNRASQARRRRWSPPAWPAAPTARIVYAACCLGDRLFILASRPAGDRQQIELPAQSYPYLPLVARKTNRLYLSLWGKSAVAVIDLDGRLDKGSPGHLADRLASRRRWSFRRTKKRSTWPAPTAAP